MDIDMLMERAQDKARMHTRADIIFKMQTPKFMQKGFRSKSDQYKEFDINEDGKQRSIYKFVNSGGSFGAGPLRQLIGLGNASRIDRVEIYWPTSDQTQVFTDVPLDSAFEVTEGQPLLKR